ncbi:MAG: hypothetical protein M3Q79_02095 [bacterium]|nr:hypothetical protein [bacterium]
MIIIHVILALSSLAVATYNLYRPASSRLKLSYALAAATLSSGVMLVFINNASVLRTCVTGLLFFALVTAMNTVSSRKLASVKI